MISDSEVEASDVGTMVLLNPEELFSDTELSSVDRSVVAEVTSAVKKNRIESKGSSALCLLFGASRSKSHCEISNPYFPKARN